MHDGCAQFRGACKAFHLQHCLISACDSTGFDALCLRSRSQICTANVTVTHVHTHTHTHTYAHTHTHSCHGSSLLWRYKAHNLWGKISCGGTTIETFYILLLPVAPVYKKKKPGALLFWDLFEWCKIDLIVNSLKKGYKNVCVYCQLLLLLLILQETGISQNLNWQVRLFKKFELAKKIAKSLEITWECSMGRFLIKLWT